MLLDSMTLSHSLNLPESIISIACLALNVFLTSLGREFSEAKAYITFKLGLPMMKTFHVKGDFILNDVNEKDGVLINI